MSAPKKPNAKKPTRTALVLLSGGIDSAACVRYYLDQGFAVEGLFVSHGQKARRFERAAAQRVARHFGIPLDEVQVAGVRWQGQMRFELQGRNALLSAVALAHFPQRSGLIAMGVHAGTPYPDCSKDFQQTAAQMAQISTQGRIAFDFPFGGSSKKQIGIYCRERAIPLELTYSCQEGRGKPCGSCPSCLDRLAIQREART